VKKILGIVAAAAGVLAIRKRRQGQQSADVWKQATR